MTDTERKGVQFNEVRGSLPAWLWKGIRESERKTEDRYFPATVIRDGNSSLIVVDADHWNDILDNEWESDT